MLVHNKSIDYEYFHEAHPYPCIAVYFRQLSGYASVAVAMLVYTKCIAVIERKRVFYIAVHERK